MIAANREIRVKCMTYKRKLEIVEKDYKEKLDNEKKSYRNLESQIILKEAEVVQKNPNLIF
jgi:hypothetical protein